MAGLHDAKDIKQLSDESRVLYDASVDVYHRLNLSMWEMATGAKQLDMDEVAKNITTFWGTIARDVGNLAMLWQQVARVAAPPAGEAPEESAPA